MFKMFQNNSKDITKSNKRDPLDMRPVAHSIVEKTLHRMDLAKKENNPKPTILIIGEIHPIPTHMVTQILVIKELKEQNINFALGMEEPHNSVHSSFINFAYKENEEYDKHRVSGGIKHKNRDGVYSLKTSVGINTYLYANLSHKILRQFALDQNISTKFNDAARDGNNLSHNDSLTKHFITKNHPGGHSITLVNKDGMHIRNNIITYNALNHATRKQAELYVQTCGLSHIAGETNMLAHYKYEHSLSALFKDESCPIIVAPLLINHYINNYMERWHFQDHEIVSNLNTPSKAIIYNAFTFAKYREQSYLNKVLSASGLDTDMYNMDDKINQYQQEMQQHFIQWKSDFQFNRP